ncbi:hypothetical protein AAHC03_016781 [Spirometra sp. Aus1]
MHARPRRKRSFWPVCFCFDSKSTAVDAAEADLFYCIARGDAERLERCLQCLQGAKKRISLTVRRHHPNRLLGSFYQECSPAMWAADCGQWPLLPILWRYGYDVNRPQFCRRWTCFCRSQHRPNNSPYRRTWTSGHYTYQSVLDYYFANTYEQYGEFGIDLEETDLPNPLYTQLSSIRQILSHGVDVHRIDSIIVFNSLAASFDHYMCAYVNPLARVPDLSESEDAFVEIEVVRCLIENGYSEFEFMDYVSPNTNWFGILICLLSHPRLPELVGQTLPSLIRSAALLLINLLALRFFLTNAGKLCDTVDNLRLRKIYVKRYCDQRLFFNARISNLIASCEAMFREPPPLGLLARNKVRHLLGGTNFLMKLSALHLPPKLASFVSYIGPEHLHWVRMPSCLCALSKGLLTEGKSQHDDGSLPIPRSPCPLQLSVPSDEAARSNGQISPSSSSSAFSSDVAVLGEEEKVTEEIAIIRAPRRLRVQRSLSFCPRPTSAPIPKIARVFSFRPFTRLSPSFR